MYCPNCGSSVAEGSEHCPRCGMQLSGSGSARAASTGSSLSSSYFNREGSAQAEHLAQVVRDALDEFGMGVLKNPRRLTAFVMDFIPEEDRVGSTFLKQCDEEYLSIFERAAQSRSGFELETAALTATQLLSEERMIVRRMASTVSESVSRGIANYLGLRVSFGAGVSPEQVKYCPYCGAGNALENVNCASCGRSMEGAPLKTVPCLACGMQNPADNDFCSACGQSLHDEVVPPPPPAPPALPTVTCPSCKAQNVINSEFCSNCGRRLRGKDSPKWLPALVAALACLVIGFAAYRLLPKTPEVPGKVDDDTIVVEQDEDGKGTDEPSDETTEPVVEEEGSYPPVFSAVSASSSLTDSNEPDKYAPQQVIDGNRQTCWAEGASDGTDEDWQKGNVTGSRADKAVGIGEYIELSAKEKQRLSGFKIINGYSKLIPDDWDSSNGRSFYYWNSRIKDASIELSDGYSQDVTFGDEGPGDWQTIEFDEPHNTTFLRILIKSVYDTNKDGTGRCNWPDTSIDEIEVF